MSTNASNSDNAQVVSGSSSRRLVHDADAWRLVMQWAEGAIEFPALCDVLSARFGERYIYDDWKALFNRVFEVSEDDAGAGVMAVKAAMLAHSVSLSNTGDGPHPSTSTGSHQAKRRRVASGAQVSREVMDTTSPPRRHKRAQPLIRPFMRAAPLVRRFLDVEAQEVDEDGEETTEEEEEEDPFIVPDGTHEDRATLPSRSPTIQSRVYLSPAAPSRYAQAIQAITQRYEQMPSDSDSEDMEVLDSKAIWTMIRDWMTSTLPFETLMRHIDFQHGKHAQISYWEDFITSLVYEDSLERREAHFASITLEDHYHRLSHATSPSDSAEATPASPPSDGAEASPASPPSDGAEVTSMWVVKIRPAASTPYLVSAWNRAGLFAVEHKPLPGCVTVSAADPNTFIRVVPRSHSSCVKGWSLLPLEERLSQRDLFGQPEPSVPGWYRISKRGIYRGDLAYAVSYDGDSDVVDLLLASRRLKDLTRQPDDDGIGQDPRARRLFSPERYHGAPQPPVRGLSCFKHKGSDYVAGLLLMRLSKHQIEPTPTPTPHDIALHVASGIDAAFMTATLQRYNQHFWKIDDSVVVCNSVHDGQRGVLLAIDQEHQSATVRLNFGGEWMISLSDLLRFYAAGDVVRVIEDPHSDLQNVHHEVIGKFGFVTYVDEVAKEVVFLDSTEGKEIRVPPFLLESYVPDQPVFAPFGSTTPPTETSPEVIEIGDSAEVKSGPHQGMQGIVEWVYRSASMVRIICPEPPSLHRRIDVPISSVSFTPPVQALRFSTARNYDVRQGDAVVVVRGESTGRSGIVSKVNLDLKTMDVASTWNPSKIFTLPIAHFAHASAVRDRDDESRYRGKEVMIIGGHCKGWRGTLVSVGKDECVVARGGVTLGSFKTDVVVARDSKTTLGGTALTPVQFFEVSGAFERAQIPEVTNRATTPLRSSTPLPDYTGQDPPSGPTAGSSSNPWVVDDDDRAAQLECSSTPTSAFEFLLRPAVVDSLKSYHAVFKIKPGWRDTYTDRHVKTEVPSPFHSPSGRVPLHHLAVSLTARTKGAAVLQVHIPERCLDPVPPNKKNTLCMVIEGKEGGEDVGVVLAVTKASTKEQRVEVKRLDGTPSSELNLPWDRVIMVERAS